MRILVHDFSGHPFQVQLSRELARRGHETRHLHCPSYVSGKGALGRTGMDPPRFSIEGIALDRPFQKYSPLMRFRQERAYGRRVARRVNTFQPDVVLSSNTPLFSQQILLRSCRRARQKFVFWQQDIYSLGMRSAVGRLPLVGHPLGRYATKLEANLLAGSDAVVVISEDFIPTLQSWGLDTGTVHVVHNWAPIDELPEVSRDNLWSREHDLTDKVVLLYSGTLGRKHDPDLLLQLAMRFRDRPDVALVVASEGAAGEWLRERAAEHHLNNLLVVGFQPYERLPEVLGSGDILLVILEEDAGVFSVPSKMLSYQCAGRPILAYLPAENLSTRIIEASNSGIAVASGDQHTYLASAERLTNDLEFRRTLGTNGRKYAEEAFNIGTIADTFERILTAVVNHP